MHALSKKSPCQVPCANRTEGSVRVSNSIVVSDFDHHARRYRHRHKLLEEKLACVRNVNLPHSARHTQCQSAASQDEARMAS